MFGLPLAFASPLVLGALLLLPIIWYLLRLTPPKPQEEVFPPLRLLQKLIKREETPAKSPWWLTLLRLALSCLLILAMAGPIWKPQEPTLTGEGNILLVIDDGWASGEIWPQMKQKATAILNEAGKKNRLVTLLTTSNPTIDEQNPLTPEAAQTVIESFENLSIRPDYKKTADLVRATLAQGKASQIVFLSDGLDHDGSELLAQSFANAATSPLLVLPHQEDMAAISLVANNPGKMIGTVVRPGNSDDLPLRVMGYDNKGLAIARSGVVIADGNSTAEFSFSEPVELRNQIVRVAIENTRHAGAVQLIDDSNRRRIVGLVSGQSIDVSQPLLSPLYYINRALAPYSDIRTSDTANLEQAIGGLLEQNISTMILADIGNLPPETSNSLSAWVSKGGMLIRFAGPRLAARPDSDLLPVELHQGDRLIGGALSWEEPKTLAPFERGSPFFGLKTNEEIKVTRQVMALQSRQKDENVWARLEDGTPLVTANRQGNGWLVLFHVNSDNNWSNLPLSGTFVDMLRRVVNLSKSTNIAGKSQEAARLPPLEIINGAGILTAPPSTAKPLIIGKDGATATSFDNPPGLYGSEDGYVALNLLNNGEQLSVLDPAKFRGANMSSYSQQQSLDLKPVMLAIAGLLFLADCLAVLWFAGALGLRGNKRAATVSTLIMVLGLAMMNVSVAFAQQTREIPISNYVSKLQARLAYVKTGDASIDKISQAGLFGLTRYLASRTALEPGDPVGVDIASDELAFYPILYWPIDTSISAPNPSTMARVDAFMKQGGSILFDTRDQISGVFSSPGGSAETLKLREILASLDIPPLEPVPPDHVLTKAFYLLDSFPGRYAGGDLWVEQIVGMNEGDAQRPARAGDGVSTILITSNDFAGAWAVDDNLRPMFPTVPPNPQQREYAFRVGVNILMYMMTGNYKADQVHIPALLERLGQ